MTGPRPDPEHVRKIREAMKSPQFQQTLREINTRNDEYLRSAMAPAAESIRRQLNSQSFSADIAAAFKSSIPLIPPSQLASIQTAVDEMAETMRTTTNLIPPPETTDWLRTISRELARTTAPAIEREINLPLDLVADQSVNETALGEFARGFVGGHADVEEAIKQGAGWVAKAFNLTLEAARLVLLTWIFLQLAFTLWIVMGATPDLVAWMSLVLGKSMLDVMAAIKRLAEGPDTGR